MAVEEGEEEVAAGEEEAKYQQTASNLKMPALLQTHWPHAH